LAQNNPGLALDQAGVRHAAQFDGDLVAAIMRRLREFPQGQPEARDLASKVVAVAETSATVASGRLGKQWDDKNMAADFKKASPEGDRDFVQKAVDLLSTLEGLGLGPFLNKNK